MCLFKTGILNAKYQLGSKQGWGDYEDNWDRIPAYKASQFRMRGKKKQTQWKFFTKETSIVSTNTATNSTETG